MSFTNINDPAGVKALLEQLRTSQAWQQVAQTTPAAPTPASTMTAAQSSTPETEGRPFATSAVQTQPPAQSSPETAPSSAVASLLSQLRADTAIAPPVAPSPAVHSAPHPYPAFSQPPLYDHRPPQDYTAAAPPLEVVHNAEPVTPAAAPSSARKQDLRSLTFQQSLPVLAQLSESPEFVKAVSSMKQEQAELERQLWDERHAITRKYEDKVAAARTKAKIVGIGLTQHEADSMSAQLRGELERFDATRAMPAWDGLLAKQQTALETLGVPTMYATTSTAEREKQQRVVQVLAGIVGGDA